MGTFVNLNTTNTFYAYFWSLLSVVRPSKSLITIFFKFINDKFSSIIISRFIKSPHSIAHIRCTVSLKRYNNVLRVTQSQMQIERVTLKKYNRGLYATQ